MIVRNVFITPTAPARALAPGTRLAVKDLFDTSGVRTTYGSAVFADHVPAATATAVTRLERAGYTTVGKANLHEFAWGITSQNAHYGHVPNPLAADRIAGGSSGGCAAALAAGLADVALGTDSGGSIRIPSACCGTVGFKPTHGLVPLDGCFPLAPSFDHAGPMARDVGGCERLLGALAPGFTSAPPVDLRDLHVGMAWTERADPLVRVRVEEAAARFGTVTRLDLPLPDGTYAAFNREAADVHRDLLREHRDSYSDNVAAKIEHALGVTDAEVAAAAGRTSGLPGPPRRLLAGVELLVTPTLAMVAPAGRGRGSPRPGSDAVADLPVQRDRRPGPRAAVRACRGRTPGFGATRRGSRRGRVRAGGRSRARGDAVAPHPRRPT